jgi:hypothetical protein
MLRAAGMAAANADAADRNSLLLIIDNPVFILEIGNLHRSIIANGAVL